MFGLNENSWDVEASIPTEDELDARRGSSYSIEQSINATELYIIGCEAKHIWKDYIS